MFNCNVIGLIEIVFAAVVMFIVGAWVGRWWGYLAFGGACVVADLFFRLNHEEQSLFSPDKGGQMFYIPVWLIGFFCFGGGLVS